MHPLAEACRRCHDFPDAIDSARVQGERLDAQIVGLSALMEPTPEAKAQIWTRSSSRLYRSGERRHPELLGLVPLGHRAYPKRGRAALSRPGVGGRHSRTGEL